MIRSRAEAVERARRDARVRRAALCRLQAIGDEIDEVTERRIAAWEDLARRPSPAGRAQIAALNDRLATLWSEARAMRACVRNGERDVIIERAQRDIRSTRTYAA